MNKGLRILRYILPIIFILSITNSFAANRTVNLIISYKTINFTGKDSQAIVVNNQIPAPTLHFKEGDVVTLNVYNHLDKETAIHWHGILVPWQMDGVLGINQQGIPPGGTFQYKFLLKQSGTYWYHAHAGLQEQQGLYGAFLIDPAKPPSYHYNKDYVIVLSDWSNTDPEQILSNLKKSGNYYSVNFPLQPSLKKFIQDYFIASKMNRQKLMNDYQMMQQMRMGLYDFSDVVYDAFLLNGQPKTHPWSASVKVGDKVRLRFIGASGNTIFHIKIPDAVMKMVQVEGNDIRPISLNDFTLAPGETIDVLVKIQKKQPYIIYAESMDKVGAAYGSLVSSNQQTINYHTIDPFPEPLPVTRKMMSMMMDQMKSGNLPGNNHSMTMSTPSHQMNHGHTHHSMDSMSHDMPMNHAMQMPTESVITTDTIMPPHSFYSTSFNTKYNQLVAAVKTNHPNKPIAGIIHMELFGYMDHFIWFINGIPEQKARPILLNPGKRYRFIFTNTSMMHHPMHIHGHWFILRKENSAYDPLLHTIDIPPGATMTVDVDTDAAGQWILHCHFLYHMMAGMSRTMQYSTLIELAKNEKKAEHIIKSTVFHNRPIVKIDEIMPVNRSLIKHPMAHPVGLWLANFVDMSINPITNIQKITFKGLYGADYNKLELFINDAEIKERKLENADIDIFYWHLLNQFWVIKGGVNYFYRPSPSPHWQLGGGIEGLLPYFIDIDLKSYFYHGSVKLDIELSRDTQITNNFFIKLGIRSIAASKTINQAAIGSGLNQMQYILQPYYRLMPGFNIFAEFERDQYYGAFKTIQANLVGHSSTDNALTFGLSLLF